MTAQSPKLLVVGSSSVARAAELDLLRQTGFEICEAGSEKEAFEKLSHETFGLILITCETLDTKGQELCQHFKKSYPKTSLLVIAAAPFEAQSFGPFQESIDGFLVEPVAPLTLITSVQTLLHLHRLETASSSADVAQNGAASDLLNAQLSALYAASIDAIVSIDHENTITSWNSAAELISGYTADEIIGTKLNDVSGTQDAQAQRRQHLQHLHEGEPIEYQAVRTRKNGDQIEVWIKAAPIKAGEGKTAGAIFFIRDITALKRHEQHVHFLMRELTHRSKNLLAVIQAMARQSLSHLNSPEDFVTRFSARLSGLAGSHDLLSNVDWEGASLIDLIKSQLRHYEDRFDQKIHIDGPDLFLRPEAAQNIGIALHELSTNAAKYGALSVPDGNVSISWKLITEKDVERLQMNWHEMGGPAVDPPSRKGFGHVVMDRITGQALGGTSRADFNPDGVTWTLDVPAASVVLNREKQKV
jgi:PAS domain S-box-containing protein